MIEYFGGLVQLVPFIPLIKGIYNNKKIKFICGITKIEVLKTIFDNIIYLLSKIINQNKEEYSIKFKKYELFVHCLILQSNYEILSGSKVDKIGKEITIRDKIFPLIRNFDDDIIITFFILGKITNKSQIYFENCLKTDEGEIVQERIYKNYNKQKNPLSIKTTYEQLFRNLMKELFIYNRFWSKKEFFFKDNINIKYKQISYYTKNFQQPLLYPILEFNEYLPFFSRFDKENLFKHDINKIVNYNISFEDNILIEIVA